MPQKIRMPKKQGTEIEGVRDGILEQVTQQHRQENIGCDQADESCRDPFDGIDETIHIGTLHVRSRRPAIQSHNGGGRIPPPQRNVSSYWASALYLVSEARSSLIAASGSP